MSGLTAKDMQDISKLVDDYLLPKITVRIDNLKESVDATNLSNKIAMEAIVQNQIAIGHLNTCIDNMKSNKATILSLAALAVSFIGICIAYIKIPKVG